MSYHAHPGEPHKWMKMESPDPTWHICPVCGEIRDKEGNTVREGAET